MAALLGPGSYVSDLLRTRCHDAHWNRGNSGLPFWNYNPEKDATETQAIILYFQVQFPMCLLCEGLPV